MSSKAGPRAEGTDGSDWQHREKVGPKCFNLSSRIISGFISRIIFLLPDFLSSFTEFCCVCPQGWGETLPCLILSVCDSVLFLEANYEGSKQCRYQRFFCCEIVTFFCLICCCLTLENTYNFLLFKNSEHNSVCIVLWLVKIC